MSVGKSGAGGGIINGFGGIVSIQDCFPTSLSRTNDGLFLQDQFTRPDGPVGNGWNESGDTVNGGIVSERVRYDGSSDYGINQPNLLTTKEVIQQFVYRPGSDLHEFTNFMNAGGGTNYAFILTDLGLADPTEWIIRRRDDGGVDTVLASTDSGMGAISVPQGQHLLHRAILDGADLIQLGLRVGAFTDIDKDVTEVQSVTDPSPPSLTGETAQITIGGTNRQIDNYFACGRYISVTDLPTGWKARIVRVVDGMEVTSSAVEEVGGIATLDPKTWSLPAKRIEVLNDSDVQQFSLTPTAPTGWHGGIWGGDTYQAS